MVAIAIALLLVVGPRAAPTTILDCRPTTIPSPPLKIAYAGPDSKPEPAHTLVILRSPYGTRRDAWPWKYISSIYLVPTSGTVESNDKPAIDSYSEVRGYVSMPDPNSTYAVFSFPAHPLGGNFRIVVNELDPSVPKGCTPNIWHFVIGAFSEP